LLKNEKTYIICIRRIYILYIVKIWVLETGCPAIKTNSYQQNTTAGCRKMLYQKINENAK